MRARGWAAVIAGAALALGYAAADAADVVPGFLTRAEPWAVPEPFPTVVLDPVPAAGQILANLPEDAPLPDPEHLARLADQLISEPAAAGGLGVVVVDVLTGQVLLDVAAAQPRVPASTLKLLTTTTALTSLGPQTRLSTSVVLAPGETEQGGEPTVYLVGGGDVLLAAGEGDPEAVVGRAGLGDLAAATAAELAGRGVGSVRLALDDTAFTGPAKAEGWGPVDLLFVSPVSPIAVDRGILPGGAGRQPDPALAAAGDFARALQTAGLVLVGDVTRQPSPTDGVVIAAVDSAPVSELVEHTLTTSDNDVAEALGRAAALAQGLDGGFSGAAAAVRDALDAAELDASGLVMADASGLSEQDAAAPLLLARLLARAATPGRADLLPVVTGLPVAGLEGTLESRFTGFDDPAAGVLRAKTGTLLTVAALAGLVADADGRLLAFAVIADRVPVGSLGPARAAIDSWVSSLAACGCR